jgi:Lon protease-like protein
LSEAHEPDARGPEPAPIPSGWPPADGDAACKVVPLFPLPNLFLFPGTVMPLHVFEPRYRQMIEDSLDGPGRLVIGTVLEGHDGELGGTPPVHQIAGLGEIARHERLPDGRFLIMLVGLARVQIDEVPCDRLYRKVNALPLTEVQVQEDEEERLRRELIDAVLARTPDLRANKDKLPPDMPVGHLADLLLLRMQLPQSAMQSLYSELVVADRARHALDEHQKRPIPSDED